VDSERGLCRGTEGAAQGEREFDGDEVVCREQIVFAGLVNDSELAVSGCLIVSEDFVDLPSFERCGVIVVLDADSEARTGARGLGCHGLVLKEALDLELELAETAGFTPGAPKMIRVWRSDARAFERR
jgi:hypothetical protein